MLILLHNFLNENIDTGGNVLYYNIIIASANIFVCRRTGEPYPCVQKVISQR